MYSKYWKNSPELRILEPHALKEFNNRWYVLAVNQDNGETRIFGLDRISNLIITNRKFHHKVNLNVNEFFQNCFGIITTNEHEPQEVILSFNTHQGKYVKSLPLHETQEILIDSNDELRIKLRVYITVDFIMEILSFGEKVKVIQPQSFIEELKSTYQDALKQYLN